MVDLVGWLTSSEREERERESFVEIEEEAGDDDDDGVVLLLDWLNLLENCSVEPRQALNRYWHPPFPFSPLFVLSLHHGSNTSA